MPSIREIAKLAGVSKSTVSLVLNNKPGVSEEKRQQVLDARDQLLTHEVMQPVDDANVSRPLTVVVLHPPILRSSYVFSEVLRGIQTAAEMYNVQLRLVSNDPNATEQHVSYLYFSDPQFRPDGVLIFGARQHEPLLDEAYRLNIPCVVLGRNADRYPVSAVGRHEDFYAYELTRYLIELGHRAVAFLGGDMGYDYLHDRLRGYEQALADGNVIFQKAWVHHGDGDAAVQQMLAHAPEATAAIFVNDTCARAGLPILKAAGLSIPQDISVASFDNTAFAQNHNPPLTSISYKRYEEGQWAIKMLIDQIRYPSIEKVQAIFKADFLKRESCAAPRSVANVK